ncbi:MAG TPA: sulfatase-like hydrolase/transferase, partial [Anaerolineales bacterium]|nr:sulfatase-like hydrolase/transferase [Anaerolineales bacterium]
LPPYADVRCVIALRDLPKYHINNMTKVSRRDFLKVSVALAGAGAFAGTPAFKSPARSRVDGKPNILIFVFDAMSARNLSLHGYPRNTTPSLEKFARRASVYHRHYAAGNFTTPGTASMLTGMYPWTHRAINYRGMVDRTLTDRNLFRLVGDEYIRLAFTQNMWADILLSQFQSDLDIHLPSGSFSQTVHSFAQPDDLPRDRPLAYYVFPDFLNLRVVDPKPFPGSLFIASADLGRALLTDPDEASATYPRGLPTNYDYSYENERVLEGIRDVIEGQLRQTSPYFAYFHLWSPHDPYSARRDFVGRFDDELQFPEKPQHPLAKSSHSPERQQKSRREYDEFIADVDAAFGKLLYDLELSGALENTYVIVTSDHGELFERGEVGHASALMYAPVTQIPLLISAPGQEKRFDFHSPTSNIDLLPTVLRMAGSETPDWVEGGLLPGFGGTEDNSRSIFSMVAKDNPAFRPLEQATFAMIRGDYELLFFTGYPDHTDAFELYNLREDPEELHDLFRDDTTVASRMKAELLEAVNTANRNYQTQH